MIGPRYLLCFVTTMTASADDETRPLLENAPEDAGKPKVNLLAVFIPMTLGIFLAAVDQTIVVACKYRSVSRQRI